MLGTLPNFVLRVNPSASGTSRSATTLPVAATTALQGLRYTGRLVAGQSVLINEAAGGVGSFAVQIAKALGAEVTGVCSTGNVELVRSLGAWRAAKKPRPAGCP
jgi:NADPH:quinone reductase-like Zn-dependent oxidoreductase